MTDINLGFKAACSHSWISNPKSFLPCRAFKALCAGIKARFGNYTVSLNGQAERLIHQNPKSYFAIEAYPILQRRAQIAEPTMHTASAYTSGPPPEYTTEAPFVKPNEDGDLPPLYTPLELPEYKEKDESPLPSLSELPRYEDIYKFV